MVILVPSERSATAPATAFPSMTSCLAAVSAYEDTPTFSAASRRHVMRSLPSTNVCVRGHMAPSTVYRPSVAFEPYTHSMLWASIHSNVPNAFSASVRARSMFEAIHVPSDSSRRPPT